MNKNREILTVALLISVIAVSGIFWFPAVLGRLKSSSFPPPTPATNVERISPTYLPGYIFRSSPNSSAVVSHESFTRIFLVSASPYYGYSNETRKSPNLAGSDIISRGDPIFIINITLRNGYNSEYPLPLSSDNYAFIFLNVTLYSQNGIVGATDVSPTDAGVPPTGAFIGLSSGETASVEVWLATSNRNIDLYEINLSVYGIAPP